MTEFAPECLVHADHPKSPCVGACVDNVCVSRVFLMRVVDMSKRSSSSETRGTPSSPFGLIAHLGCGLVFVVLLLQVLRSRGELSCGCGAHRHNNTQSNRKGGQFVAASLV